jgi:hypothetical protein
MLVILHGKTLARKSLSRAISNGSPPSFPNTLLNAQSMNKGENLTGSSLLVPAMLFLSITLQGKMQMKNVI